MLGHGGKADPRYTFSPEISEIHYTIIYILPTSLYWSWRIGLPQIYVFPRNFRNTLYYFFFISTFSKLLVRIIFVCFIFSISFYMLILHQYRNYIFCLELKYLSNGMVTLALQCAGRKKRYTIYAPYRN